MTTYFDDISVSGTTVTNKLIGSNILPTVVLAGPNIVGAGASYSIIGSQLAGKFSLNSGTGEDILPGGAIATFTLSTPMASSNYYIFFNLASFNIDNICYAVPNSASTFTLYVNGIMPNRTYDWYYLIVG